MSLRMRCAVSFDLKTVFSSFRILQKLFLLFSCPFTTQSDLKVFHIASSILKAISHALIRPISSRSMPSNAAFVVDNRTYQTKFWPCRPANKHQQKDRKMEEFEGMPLEQKKSICVFLLHIASMPRIMHPDVWTRVNAGNVSIRHV